MKQVLVGSCRGEEDGSGEYWIVDTRDYLLGPLHVGSALVGYFHRGFCLWCLLLIGGITMTSPLCLGPFSTGREMVPRVPTDTLSQCCAA